MVIGKEALEAKVLDIELVMLLPHTSMNSMT